MGKNLVRNLSGKIEFARLLDVNEVVLPKHINSDSFLLDLASLEVAEMIDENDVVIHLAWRSNPSLTGSDVEAERKLNWGASKNLIDICTKKKAKLLFISSGGTVYGRPAYTPIDEKHPLAPISAYGKVKLEVEEEILRSSEKEGLKYVILRPSNLYGPGFSTDKGLGVIGHWVRQIKESQPLRIVGDGEQVRDFIHVDELSDAIMHCIDLENEILNVGTGTGISLNHLRKIFEEVIGYQIEVIRLEERDFDVANNVLSIEHIRQITSWKPHILLSKGIAELMK